jgi:glycine/D-amino acid oxidase-like deaminating enzyme
VYDVAIIGGGIIGTSAAAYLAEAGVSVVLFEQSEVGAGASGRNSGVLQHPYDPLLAALHAETLALYAELAATDDGFDLPAGPAGLLLVSADDEAVEMAARSIGESTPELAPEIVPSGGLTQLEPAVAPGIAGCLLATGYPVVPAAATAAFARRAQRAGVELRIGSGPTRPALADGRARGVITPSGERVATGAVLLAAGPWTPGLVPAWASHPPIERTWGVVVAAQLPEPPRRVLEELGIDPGGDTEPMSFSLVTAGGTSSIGSTFLRQRPEPTELVERIMGRAARFVPTIADVRSISHRACARPVSFDGRPLIGRIPNVDGLFTCAGHGPWGMSTGPASARLVASVMLASGVSGASVPAGLEVARFVTSG